MPTVDLATLASHPIFEPAQDFDPKASTLSLRDAALSSALVMADVPSSCPRHVLCVRESDVIVAVGNQLRMAPIARDKTASFKFKVLEAENVSFKVAQMLLSPNAKLLAVTDGRQAAVVVLPRSGYSKTDGEDVQVKSLAVGPAFHKRKGTSTIVKLNWHPWGEHGAVLLVGTSDGKIREYDLSREPEQPQQTISFMPQQSRKTILADASERELTSFTLASGEADWGPLTLYGLMRNGDIYAFAPYMPVRAAIPASYIWSLKHFVSEKLEAAGRRPGFAGLYEQQLRFVQALESQLPTNKTVAGSQPIAITAPQLTKLAVARQGPFLLQPEPLEVIDGSTDAIDLAYVQVKAVGGELGVVLVSFQNGKIDVLLDLSKAEALWEHGQAPQGSDVTLTVFESIDLGICEALRNVQCKDIVEATSRNFPVFQVDPVYSDTVYVAHAFGVHCLWLRGWVSSLLGALTSAGAKDSPTETLGTNVVCMLDTTGEDKTSVVPIVGIAVSNSIYSSYGLVALASSLKCVVFDLTLRADAAQHPMRLSKPPAQTTPTDKAYVSLLEPWAVPAVFQRPASLAPPPRIALPPATSPSTPHNKELVVNPETLRLFGTVVDRLLKEVAAIRAGVQEIQLRVGLHQMEQRRQVDAASKLQEKLGQMKSADVQRVRDRLQRVAETQGELLKRLDKTLQLQMDAACPTLSRGETEWFEELKLAKKLVHGAEGGRSLQARTEVLETSLDQLRPDMQQLSLNEQKSAPMGSSQVLRIMKRLREESDLIKDLTGKLQDMRDRLGISS